MRQPPSLDAFGPGGFRVSGVWRPGSLLILDDAPGPWRPTRFEELTLADFDQVAAGGAALSEFVLLGTGAEQRLPAAAIGDALRALGVGLEFMASPAAARAHNILVSQGRRFATALIAL